MEISLVSWIIGISILISLGLYLSWHTCSWCGHWKSKHYRKKFLCYVEGCDCLGVNQ